MDEGIYQVEFFTDTKKLEKEKLQQRTRLMKPCLFLPLQSAKMVPWKKCIFESSLKIQRRSKEDSMGKQALAVQESASIVVKHVHCFRLVAGVK